MASAQTAAPAAAGRHRVVIVGGGFGGLNAALSLRRAAVEVTVLDRRNFHLFQPLLYQVATGGPRPATSRRRSAGPCASSATPACCWARSWASTRAADTSC